MPTVCIAGLMVALSAALAAQTADPRLTVADVEKVTGLKGVQLVSPGSVTGAGAGLNFAGPGKHMVLMVNFGPAALYQRAKDQKTVANAISLTAYYVNTRKATLTMNQLKQLAAIAASRL
jgi:hypothetical protein